MLIDNKRIIDQKLKKKSLILAGGGMRLAYQAGVLIALEEKKIPFNHVDGTSGGIFNAGMLASGLAPHEIAERWRNLNIKHFMSMRPLKSYFKPLNMMGYADADGIRTKIFPGLGIDIKKINSNQHVVATFNVCNFSHKTIEAIDHKNAEEDHLIAGVSLPIVMPALKINEQWYSDAVWIKDANLIEAVKRGAEELWLVWAIGNTETYLPGALNQYVHMIEMSANGGLLEEYDRIQMINGDIEKGNKPYGQQNPVRLFVIKPEYPLPLDPDLYLNKIDARSLINMGYAHAKNNLNSIPEKGVLFNRKATKMADPGTRLNSRAEFHGSISNNKEHRHTDFYIYFVLSAQANQNILRAYSSIKIDLFDCEIPCFMHQIEAASVDGKKSLECTCQFNYKDEMYSLIASWELNSEIDFLLGLEFKSVQLSISKIDDPEFNYKGILYQNIKQRLKALFSTNVRKQDGTSGGMRQRYKMVSIIYNYTN